MVMKSTIAFTSALLACLMSTAVALNEEQFNRHLTEKKSVINSIKHSNNDFVDRLDQAAQMFRKAKVDAVSSLVLVQDMAENWDQYDHPVTEHDQSIRRLKGYKSTKKKGSKALKSSKGGSSSDTCPVELAKSREEIEKMKDKLNEPSYLYVQIGNEATLSKTDDGKYFLTLTDLADETWEFSDRPYRSESTRSTKRFFDEWPMLFGNNQPNAAFTFEHEDESELNGPFVSMFISAAYAVTDNATGATTYTYELEQSEEQDRVMSLSMFFADEDGDPSPETFENVSIFIDSLRTGLGIGDIKCGMCKGFYWIAKKALATVPCYYIFIYLIEIIMSFGYLLYMGPTATFVAAIIFYLGITICSALFAEMPKFWIDDDQWVCAHMGWCDLSPNQCKCDNPDSTDGYIKCNGVSSRWCGDGAACQYPKALDIDPKNDGNDNNQDVWNKLCNWDGQTTQCVCAMPSKTDGEIHCVGVPKNRFCGDGAACMRADKIDVKVDTSSDTGVDESTADWDYLCNAIPPNKCRCTNPQDLGSDITCNAEPSKRNCGNDAPCLHPDLMDNNSDGYNALCNYQRPSTTHCNCVSPNDDKNNAISCTYAKTDDPRYCVEGQKCTYIGEAIEVDLCIDNRDNYMHCDNDKNNAAWAKLCNPG